MAKLSYKSRKKLPGKDFAVPGRKYPIEDKAHARNALARVAQHGTPEQKHLVEKKVHAKFPGIGKKSKGGVHKVGMSTIGGKKRPRRKRA